MTIGQAQILFSVLMAALIIAIGIGKLCDWIKALFTVPLEDLPEAEPIAKSPAPVGAEDEADGNTHNDYSTKEANCK
jgi:hypothetical protein